MMAPNAIVDLLLAGQESSLLDVLVQIVGSLYPQLCSSFGIYTTPGICATSATCDTFLRPIELGAYFPVTFARMEGPGFVGTVIVHADASFILIEDRDELPEGVYERESFVDGDLAEG